MYLENMECLVLYHSAVVFQQVHAQFQVLSTGHVFCHDIVIGPVKEELAE